MTNVRKFTIGDNTISIRKPKGEPNIIVAKINQIKVRFSYKEDLINGDESKETLLSRVALEGLDHTLDNQLIITVKERIVIWYGKKEPYQRRRSV